MNGSALRQRVRHSRAAGAQHEQTGLPAIRGTAPGRGTFFQRIPFNQVLGIRIDELSGDRVVIACR